MKFRSTVAAVSDVGFYIPGFLHAICKGSSLNLLLILNEFMQINQLLLPLNLSEYPWFSDDFRENKS